MTPTPRIVIHAYDERWPAALENLGATPTDINRDHVPPGDESEPAAWEKHYFRATGRSNQRYALLFRDYLRHSTSAAAAYAEVKLALARLHPDDAAAYYDVKDPVCDLVMDAAQRWAVEVEWSP